MTEAEKEIYEYSNAILSSGQSEFDYKWDYKFEHTERCIEVPWLATMLNKYKIQSLLDVGFTFASHDYLRLILNWYKAGHDLVGTDIIPPEKVQGRYPKEWLDEINNLQVYINDISSAPILDLRRDAVSMISTMEHIGFDKPSATIPSSAFERSQTADDVIQIRDSEIENKVLDNVAEMLRDGGYLFISVPAGKGGPVLIEDSMGLYGCYWEYEDVSWRKIIEHKKFTCIDKKFFIERNKEWIQVPDINDLNGVTANMKNYAAGVAISVLQKK